MGSHNPILEVKTPTNTPKITPTIILTPFVLFLFHFFLLIVFISFKSRMNARV